MAEFSLRAQLPNKHSSQPLSPKYLLSARQLFFVPKGSTPGCLVSIRKGAFDARRLLRKIQNHGNRAIKAIGMLHYTGAILSIFPYDSIFSTWSHES